MTPWSLGRGAWGIPEKDLGYLHALANGGNVTMPLADMFWGAYFGAVTDRFGVQWMVNGSWKE